MLGAQFKLPKLKHSYTKALRLKMNENKPSLIKQILQQKLAAQKAGRKFGILGDAELSKQFSASGKPQPIIRRGGRNGSGKP